MTRDPLSTDRATTPGPVPAHTVLVLDRSEPEDSPLYQAITECYAGNRFKHTYTIAFVRLDSTDEHRFLAKLNDLLTMESGPLGEADRESMLRLRGIVFDKDRIGQFSAVHELIRSHLPTLYVGYVAENSEASSEQDTDTELSFNCHCVAAGARRYECGAATMLRTLDTIIDDYYHAPYWEALRTYANRRTSSFHALPIGQTCSATPSIADFVSFYGGGLLSAETSLSTSPLDSLLDPKGSILRAQRKAAIAFGSAIRSGPSFKNYGTRFVTSGTSAANRIIISSFVKPDDYVLLDHSCHVSHYYALAYTYARPVIVEPFFNSLGIAGPTPTERLATALRQLLIEKHRLPAAVILTNPTFDGIYFRPQLVVKALREVLTAHWREYRGTPQFLEILQSVPRAIADASPVTLDGKIDLVSFLVTALRSMVFIFDEAWSAHGFFHPKLVRFSAMHAAVALAREDPSVYAAGLRFYATQSIHKSLSAFRQGSMIHYRDPVKHLPDFEHMFAQSFRVHTTTSPNASIIASLDVARRQGQLDGLELVDKSIRLAERFRRDFSRSARPRAAGFYVVEKAEMIPRDSAGVGDDSLRDFFIDPTRVTITWDFAVTGPDVQRLLLERGVQVNKFDARSILAIFNIGSTGESIEKLRHALRSVEELLEEDSHGSDEGTAGVRLPPAFGRMHDENNLGWWMKNLGNHRRLVLDVEDTCRDMLRPGNRRKSLISANFVMPYPPGYPILVPGQLVKVEDLQFLLGLAVRNVLGVERIDGRLKMAVFAVRDGEDHAG